MFADTKATMIKANKLGNNRVNRLLSQSLFLISTAGNDFLAFGDGRATRSDASAYIAKMVTTYLKHIKVGSCEQWGAKILVAINGRSELVSRRVTFEFWFENEINLINMFIF